jgi:predicted RNase H-like nuclease (RuvC/YqgF family)
VENDELDEAWAAADEYELLWHRAREGAAGARRGIERLQAKIRRLEERYRSDSLEIASLHSRCHRLTVENKSLHNKVERLSLRLIDSWGKEASGGRREADG